MHSVGRNKTTVPTITPWEGKVENEQLGRDNTWQMVPTELCMTFIHVLNKPGPGCSKGG